MIICLHIIHSEDSASGSIADLPIWIQARPFIMIRVSVMFAVCNQFFVVNYVYFEHSAASLQSPLDYPLQ